MSAPTVILSFLPAEIPALIDCGIVEVVDSELKARVSSAKLLVCMLEYLKVISSLLVFSLNEGVHVRPAFIYLLSDMGSMNCREASKPAPVRLDVLCFLVLK